MIIWPRRSGKTTLLEQAITTPPQGWAAQQLQMPASWYNGITLGCGAEFPVSGDETAKKSNLLKFVREVLGIELTPWQERLLTLGGKL